MPVWLLVLLVFLATHRLTRLMVADELPLVKVPRDKITDWLDPEDRRAPLGGFGKSIAYMMSCAWCMSAYTGGLIVFITSQVASLPVPLLVWAAASSVTGLIAGFESHREMDWEIAELQKQRLEAGRTRQWPT